MTTCSTCGTPLEVDPVPDEYRPAAQLELIAAAEPLLEQLARTDWAAIDPNVRRLVACVKKWKSD